MKGLDVVLTATQPWEAAKIDEVPKWDLFDKPGFMMPFNVAGYPAIPVCAGFGAGGLPVAIQLAGKPFQEPPCSAPPTPLRKPPRSGPSGRRSWRPAQRANWTITG